MTPTIPQWTPTESGYGASGEGWAAVVSPTGAYEVATATGGISGAVPGETGEARVDGAKRIVEAYLRQRGML